LSLKIEEVRETTRTKTENKMAPTIFHGLLTNDNLPESERATSRLVDEARIILAAGTDTTANTLAAITYHLLANPGILKRLKDELATAIPNPDAMPESSQIEGLPYLTAVIQEGIRLHPGVSFRQDRIAQDEDLIYEDVKTGKKYIIPRGVGPYSVHLGISKLMNSRLQLA
jgi:cytochrome P450